MFRLSEHPVSSRAAQEVSDQVAHEKLKERREDITAALYGRAGLDTPRQVSIALLLSGTVQHGDGATDDALSPDALITLLPSDARAELAICRAFDRPMLQPDEVLLLGPRGILRRNALENLGERLRSVDYESSVERLLAAAYSRLEAGDLESARIAYAGCDALLSGERGPRRAEVLTCLARIYKQQGQIEDSVRYLDEALAIFPGHRGALSMRLDLAQQMGDPALSAALRARFLPTMEVASARAHVLAEIAETLLTAVGSFLEQALQIRGRGDLELLGRLRAVREAAGDTAGAIESAVAIAEATQDSVTRAKAFCEAAQMCAKSDQRGRAVALYEAAIADDPSVSGAFEAIEQTLLDGGDFPGAERAYVRQIERLTTSPLGETQQQGEASIQRKLAHIRRDRLDNRQGAITALDRLVMLSPQDLDARIEFAELLEAEGAQAVALQALEMAAAIAPTQVRPYRALTRVAIGLGDHDRAYAASAVLVHLGEATGEEQSIYRMGAPLVAQQPSRALDDGAYLRLAHRDHDPIVAAIVHAIAPAAVSLRLDQLREKKLQPKLDPKDRQDPEKSTISAVRTAAWVARLLGVPAPDVFLRPGERVGLALPLTPQPSLVMGESMLSGRSVPELVFLLAYEMAFDRLSGRMLRFFPTLPELRSLVVAAIALAMPQQDVGADVEAIRHALGQRLDSVQKLKLHQAVTELTRRGGQLDLARFLRNLDLLACRTALVATGDVTVAARLLSVTSASSSGLSAADRVRDLLPFSVGSACSEVRHAIGVAIRRSGSMPPPTGMGPSGSIPPPPVFTPSVLPPPVLPPPPGIPKF